MSQIILELPQRCGCIYGHKRVFISPIGGRPYVSTRRVKTMCCDLHYRKKGKNGE